jgi:hypothetical protein
MKILSFIVIAFLASANALAGTSTGKISSITVTNDSSVVLFSLTSPINKTPKCNEEGRFSIQLRKPGGMTAYTAILEAKKQDYEVTVNGLNTCDWRSENVKDITLY